MSKHLFLTLILLFFFFNIISPKSQDYARHIELSLLFYECQRSGPLPETNRIFWRHDSMVDAGDDVGVDLTGGYYDAGDNVKFNFPQSAAMTLIAWSGIEFPDAYKSANQWKYFLDTVKWGTDYFIKCHSGKNELYVQVGNGQVDHTWWYPPEYINYEYPSFKIDEKGPGSEVAAETAASLAAASILFKSEDSSYSATCLKHAKELYEFADTYRDDYVKTVQNAQGFYNTYSGYIDELAWGAAWLYYATGDESYKEKYDVIADAEWNEHDPRKFTGCTGPISWDDKRPGAYVLMAKLTKEEKRMEAAIEYCDEILTQPRTKGGLWYDTQLSKWASNRYAANAASMLAVMATILPESDSKRKDYIDFVKSQIDYILGDNPAGVNYVVGAEENSPKCVHHRGASSTYGPSAEPKWNIFTLYGALAGGPGPDDEYTDNRNNYEMNEVALDYNAGFTFDLAALLHFGYGVKDGAQNFDRAWPPKAPTPDVSVSMDSDGITLSTGSGMLCSSWCISFKMDFKIERILNCIVLKNEAPDYTFCNNFDDNFLDGKGGEKHCTFQMQDKNGFEAPSEFELLCDGFHSPNPAQPPNYKPEFGHSYKVTAPGGPSKTEPLFEKCECWPCFLCKK